MLDRKQLVNKHSVDEPDFILHICSTDSRCYWFKTMQCANRYKEDYGFITPLIEGDKGEVRYLNYRQQWVRDIDEIQEAYRKWKKEQANKILLGVSDE